MSKITLYLDGSVHVGVANGLKRRGVDADFLTLAKDFEHNGIVFVHQEKYSINIL